MEGFAGKVAAVTGAGSGIGQALAIELARSGASVAIRKTRISLFRRRFNVKLSAISFQRSATPAAAPELTADS